MRVGTPALSTRGFKEADFERVGDILDRTLRLGLVLQSRVSYPPTPQPVAHLLH